MNANSAGLITTGKELNWLVKTLPFGAQNNWNPFDTTGGQARQMWRLVINTAQWDSDVNWMIKFLQQNGIASLRESEFVMLARTMNSRN